MIHYLAFNIWEVWLLSYNIHLMMIKINFHSYINIFKTQRKLANFIISNILKTSWFIDMFISYFSSLSLSKYLFLFFLSLFKPSISLTIRIKISLVVLSKFVLIFLEFVSTIVWRELLFRKFECSDNSVQNTLVSYF